VHHSSGRITSDFAAVVTIVVNSILRSIVHQFIHERLHLDFVWIQLWVAKTFSRPSDFFVGGANIHLRYTSSNIEFTQIICMYIYRYIFMHMTLLSRDVGAY